MKIIIKMVDEDLFVGHFFIAEISIKRGMDVIVREFKIGNTLIGVHDDCYKDKTKEDIEEIIKKLEEIASMVEE